MSHEAERWAKAQRGSLSTGARLTLRCLADAVNSRTRQCNPSRARLADEMGCSEDSVSRYVAELTQLGLVSIDRTIGVSTQYSLNISGGEPSANYGGAQASNGTRPGRQFAAPPSANSRPTLRKFASDPPQIVAQTREGTRERTREENQGNVRARKPATDDASIVASEGAKPGARAKRSRARSVAVSAQLVGVADEAQFAPAKASARRPPSGSGFDAFWHRYPLKVGKDAARRAWDSAERRAPAETIIAGLVERLPVFPTEKRFIKHPSTWLNGGCWTDDVEALRARQQPAEAPRRRTVSDAWDEIEGRSAGDQQDEGRFGPVIDQWGNRL